MSLIPAATVLLLRQNNNVMEVLLVERSSNTAFGDLYVFPGGKVDSEDNFSDKLSSHSDLNDADCSKLLDIENGGASFWIACIRECFEEVGVLLARKKDGSKIDLNNKDKINPFYQVKDYEDLREIPSQKISIQEKKQNSARNPFTSIQANSSNGNLILSKNIVFTGIAKVGNSNVVFAETQKGRSFLKVGSEVGNGYSISSIDIEESRINISNGILKYKVELKKK